MYLSTQAINVFNDPEKIFFIGAVASHFAFKDSDVIGVDDYTDVGLGEPDARPLGNAAGIVKSFFDLIADPGS